MIRNLEAAVVFGLLGALLGTASVLTRGPPGKFLNSDSDSDDAEERELHYAVQRRVLVVWCLPLALVVLLYHKSFA
jgi:hypothetical protein